MFKKVYCSLLIVCVIMLAGCGSPEELLSVLNTTAAPETLAVTEAETEPDTVPETAVGTYAKEDGRVYADLDALNEIEKNDNFAITIVEREIFRDAYKGTEAVFDGEDAIVFDVVNNSDELINNIKFLLFPTNGRGEGVSIDKLSFSTDFLGDDDYYSDKVQVLSTENADLASGSTEQFAVQCDASKIVNMNAIVYSYVDSNGEEIINENIYDWLVNTQEGYQIKTYTVD